MQNKSYVPQKTSHVPQKKIPPARRERDDANQNPPPPHAKKPTSANQNPPPPNPQKRPLPPGDSTTSDTPSPRAADPDNMLTSTRDSEKLARTLPDDLELKAKAEANAKQAASEDAARRGVPPSGFLGGQTGR